MKKRFWTGMIRYASGIGIVLGLGSWIAPLLFFVTATSTRLNWWHPMWAPHARKTLFLLLAVFSVANCLLYTAFFTITLLLKVRLGHDDKTLRRQFNLVTLIAVHVLLTFWGVVAQKEQPSPFLFWGIVAVWAVGGVGGVALEMRRLRRETVRLGTH